MEDDERPKSRGLHRDSATAEYVSRVKERAAFQNEIEELKKEVNKTKGQNYDLLKKIEEQDNRIKELKSELDSQKNVGGKKKKPVKRRAPRSKAKDGTTMDKAADIFESSETLYATIAERFPEMPLSRVIFAEKKFVEADVNNDGAIDADELEKILDSSNLLFTKQQVKDILKKIDTDQTNSLDFFECLKVLDLILANRRTDLPQSIQQNKSTLCVIQ